MQKLFSHIGTPSTNMRTRAELWNMETATERDELGQFPVSPKLVCRLWAAVTPQTGSLLTGRLADTQISRTTHKVTIRYRKGVTPDMWLEIQGQRYEILYILDPYLRHDTLELFCEVKADG